MGAATADGHPYGIRGLAQGITHFTHLGQQTSRVLMNRRIQLDHRAGDFGFDTVGHRMIGQLSQQLIRGRRQIETRRIDQLKFQLNAQGVGGRGYKRNLFHLRLLVKTVEKSAV